MDLTLKIIRQQKTKKDLNNHQRFYSVVYVWYSSINIESVFDNVSFLYQTLIRKDLTEAHNVRSLFPWASILHFSRLHSKLCMEESKVLFFPYTWQFPLILIFFFGLSLLFLTCLFCSSAVVYLKWPNLTLFSKLLVKGSSAINVSVHNTWSYTILWQTSDTSWRFSSKSSV